MIDSTCRRLVSSRRLLALSRTQIACSRRLLNPWLGISGGSLDDALDSAESNLYQHVRASRTLPLGLDG